MGRRRDNNKWSFVGGGCDLGEDPEKALKREVKEESDLTVTSSRLVMVEKHPNVMVYVYEAKTKGEIDPSKDPDNEFIELSWEDPFDHVYEMSVPASRNTVLKYLAHKP